MALKIKKVDTSKSAEARWEQYDEDTKVLLMPLDNTSYQIGLERMRRRLSRNDAKFDEGGIGVVEGEKSEHDYHCMLLAQFILQDWTGAVDEAGSQIPYSETVGTQMLQGDVGFFLFVIRRAAAIASDNKEEREEIAGKPSSDIDGKANGASVPKSEA